MTHPDPVLPSLLPARPAGTKMQRLTVHLDILGANGKPDPAARPDAFSVELVQIGVGLPAKVPPTPMPARGPLVLEIDRHPAETSNNYLYLRGPGHLGLPHVRNWASNASVRPVGDAEIRFTLQDDPQSDYPAVPPGWVNPRASDPPEVLPPATPPAAGGPVVQGRLDLRAVAIDVSVTRRDGTPVTDYLCQIRQHDGALPLTQTREVGTGRRFHIRASSVTTYVWLWQAGNKAKTFQRRILKPGAQGATETVDLVLENVPLQRRNAVIDTPPSLMLAPNVSVATCFTKHPEGSQLTSGYTRGIATRLREHAETWVGQHHHPQPGTLRVLAYKGTTVGEGQEEWFKTFPEGWYRWVARRYHPDTDTYGAVIDKDMTITRMLVDWFA